MTYVPHTEAERAEMLAAIGADRLEALFRDVPENVRFPKLELPPPCSEIEIEREMRELSARNFTPDPSSCFLGAGTYHHHRPATVDYVLQRGELYTAYTPYQPEVSQGVLQALFEYQSMICRLMGLEVSNASHYDGATALAEAVLLALNVGQGKRTKVLLSPAVHPQYRAVVKTYLRGMDATITGDADGSTGLDQLTTQLDETTAALVIQNPNFFGQFEPVDGLAAAVHAAGALLIVGTDPIALGRFRPPGAYGADIAVAEGQCLGIPPTFGGPHLGIFATRLAHVRRLSGHLVGETVDLEGRRGYVLTLATREQHIRRARATSNICTNSTACALAAAAYLASMGKSGLRKVAELCFHNSHYAAAEIASLPGFAVNPPAVNPRAPDRPFFKEFVVRLPRPVSEVNRSLREQFGIIGGYDLGRDYPHLTGHTLLAVTELHTRADIDRLVAALGHAAK
ncbi:MAG TPA: aminomethyl-transferring glycine dehydrogenase subunit GcvPA [Bradyrhizobium sp.]|nr:aminomethyl-transferring glycine dehydrogenase subunit GcvPA [Bradyrhizobium sp.]